MLARVLPVVLSAATLTVTAQNAMAANGPSVPLPPVGSTPVSQQTMGGRGADPASDAALNGNQGPKSSPDGGGNAKASPLSPSATWSVSGQSGDFSWSYPLRVPPSPGGFTPQLGLAYSSSAVDGRTSAANNQASWVGDGWDLSVGFIERSYMPCASDDMGGTTPSDKMGDLCWRSDNAMASYGSKASELIRDDNGKGWHPRADDGSRVAKLTNAGNGAKDGEYWQITTVDGTRYLYGSRPDASSTWTVPVYGDDDGEPCHQNTFEASSCTQAWRWNLDKVIDRNGNVILYNYVKETNSYGPANKDAAVSYVRGGTLTSAEYGIGTDSTQPTGRVEFTTADRCVPGSDCSPDKKDNWPDVPWDDKCDTATCVDNHGPSFWSTKRLAKVTTKVWTGSAWKDVDSWSLDQQFPDPGDGEKAALWLKGITHTGLAGDTPVSLPAVTFKGAAYPNRVVKQDGIGPLNRYRITAVVSETGGITSVNYAKPECTPVHVPDKAKPETNSMRCYPQTWAKRDYAEQTDFFQKYVVESTVQSDRISTNPEVQTSYEYIDGAAWAYDTSEFTKEKNRTWNEFRGFDKVRIRTGQPDDPSGPVTMVEQRFYRGMNGDHLPDGTRPVSITDSADGWRVDDEWLRGNMYETQTHDGTSENVVTKTITTPKVQGPTADRAGRKAYMVTAGLSVTYAVRNAGGWRTTKSEQTFDSFGQLTQTNDLGDIDTAADDQCTTVTYNRNSDVWLMALQATTETVGKACGKSPTFPGDAIAASRFAYDTKGFDVKPTKGNVTRTEVLDQRPAGSTKPTYALASTSANDNYGRVTSATDANNNTTLTAYTPSSGGPVTATTVTNAKQQATMTTVETAYGQPVMVTDPNGRNTVTSYDALGRKAAVWLANRDSTKDSPNQRFSYAYHDDAPTVVTISALGPNGNYTTSNELYDGLLRLRQVQQPAPGGGRLLIDTRYDTQGRQFRTTKPYFNDAAVDDKLWVASDAAVASQTVARYDGAGRTVASIVKGGTAELWRTTTSYDADRTNVTPPTGGTATTTISNARGQTTELRQYHGPKPEDDYDSTTYQYTPAGDLAVLTDPVGTVWKRGYDLHRRKVRDEDPDKGVSTMTYDNVGNLATATDSKNATLAYEYDTLNRKIAMHSGSKTGPLLADWTYDTVRFAKGQLASSTRYVDTKEYKSQVLGYSALYQATGRSITIPDKGLDKTYSTYSTYNWDGSVSGATYAPIGTLGAETLTYGRNDLGAPTSLDGSVKLVSEVDYTRYAEIERLQLGTGTQRVWVSRYYDDNTRRLKRSIVDAEVPAPMQADYGYTYDPAGNILSVANTPLGQTADTQCVKLDYLQRLTEAWTPSGTCDQQPDVTKLGSGQAPYWQSFTYDKVGNRRTETQHSTGGDTVRTYTYPAADKPQPHTLTSVKTTSPAGANTDTFGYNTIGQTTTRKAGATQQTYEWDAEGHVSKVTAGDKSTTYVYDANGVRLISKDDTGTTLYLGNEQLKLTTSGQLQPTRYYDLDGKAIAIRDGKGLSWVTSDEQGTAQISVNPNSLVTTQRRQLPFGAPRGQAVDFPGQRGFVGGVTDTSIGTTHLGAREYDPALGRFLSVDGLINTADPQQMQGYSYADNSPLTKLDPSGLIWGWLSDVGHGIVNAANAVSDAAGVVDHWLDDHTGVIGLVLGVAGMVIGTATGFGVVIFVAGVLVNAYDTYKAATAEEPDPVGFGLGVAGLALGAGSRTVSMVSKWINAGAGAEGALEGAGKAQDLVGGALGAASAGSAEYQVDTPQGRREVERKKKQKHDDDLAADIAAMKASQCPSLVGVLPVPGPCADSDLAMADPMKNKYCGIGMDNNIAGCIVFGADGWNGRRAPKQGPQVCQWMCLKGTDSWGPAPSQPRRDPTPQYSGYHTDAYLDMHYR